MPSALDPIPQFIQPPWILHGNGIVALTFPSKRAIRPDPPAGFEIEAPWWNRTMAGLVLARYETFLTNDDPLPWHEWGHIRCYARSRDKTGFVLDTISTDSETAREYGKTLWGIDKCRADITIDFATKSAALSSDHGTIEIGWKEYGFRFPIRKPFHFLTVLEQETYLYKISVLGHIRPAAVRVLRHTHTQFPMIEQRTYLGAVFNDTSVVLQAPRRIDPPGNETD